MMEGSPRNNASCAEASLTVDGACRGKHVIAALQSSRQKILHKKYIKKISCFYPLSFHIYLKFTFDVPVTDEAVIISFYQEYLSIYLAQNLLFFLSTFHLQDMYNTNYSRVISSFFFYSFNCSILFLKELNELQT